MRRSSLPSETHTKTMLSDARLSCGATPCRPGMQGRSGACVVEARASAPVAASQRRKTLSCCPKPSHVTSVLPSGVNARKRANARRAPPQAQQGAGRQRVAVGSVRAGPSAPKAVDGIKERATPEPEAASRRHERSFLVGNRLSEPRP